MQLGSNWVWPCEASAHQRCYCIRLLAKCWTDHMGKWGAVAEASVRSLLSIAFWWHYYREVVWGILGSLSISKMKPLNLPKYGPLNLTLSNASYGYSWGWDESLKCWMLKVAFEHMYPTHLPHPLITPTTTPTTMWLHRNIILMCVSILWWLADHSISKCSLLV